MTIGFIAYIDESGDDGLRRVFPKHPGGSPEWFIISCVVVKVDRDPSVVGWVKNIVGRLDNAQRPDLHFSDLRRPAKKRMVCEAVAALPLRCFVVISNKKNMIGYRNWNLPPNRNWFYWWLTRCLLERVTDFCLRRSMKEYGEPRTVRIVFSRRGGMSYDHFRAYLRLLKSQSMLNDLYLKQGDLKWAVIDTDEVFAYDHRARAGLQLADTVASAFFQGVAIDKGPCEPEYAKLLKPRIYRGPTGHYLGHGIKPLPSPVAMKLELEQRELFEFYGFPKRKW